MDLFEVIFFMFVIEQNVGTKFALMEGKGFLVMFGYIANLFPHVKTTRRAIRVAGRMGDSSIIMLRTKITVPNRACMDMV